MEERVLAGGKSGGAVRIGNTVRRQVGPGRLRCTPTTPDTDVRLASMADTSTTQETPSATACLAAYGWHASPGTSRSDFTAATSLGPSTCTISSCSGKCGHERHRSRRKGMSFLTSFEPTCYRATILTSLGARMITLTTSRPPSARTTDSSARARDRNSSSPISGGTCSRPRTLPCTCTTQVTD
jgi:hypothetical protein